MLRPHGTIWVVFYASHKQMGNANLEVEELRHRVITSE